MIDPILNERIRHAINTTLYGNFVLAKMIRILNLTDVDLIAQLAVALAIDWLQTDRSTSSFRTATGSGTRQIVFFGCMLKGERVVVL
ncbi:hypothetical protein [Janthinobacterium sp. SUN033]|uniref:hypothetical protein n=1 Tax=Janthinobacterium sp. SUN033 TaxID=3002439 RepID=UPI0025B03840|nr:hypothetical protein [Janthinobacterium sp. SUN033]MDN2676717.1 hypothetical protein [Janthinobacterium sp. SUN033]